MEPIRFKSIISFTEKKPDFYDALRNNLDIDCSVLISGNQFKRGFNKAERSEYLRIYEREPINSKINKIAWYFGDKDHFFFLKNYLKLN